MSIILDGKAVAYQILQEIKQETLNLPRKPCLGVLLAGEHPASKIYVKRKMEACQEVGILSHKEVLPADASGEEILQVIARFNADPHIDGILVQLPLPTGINPIEINRAINPGKDVDGFHPLNMGKLLLGEKDGFCPCTPLGIQTLLLRCGVAIAGKQVVIVGRSNIVGKPLAALLMQSDPNANATVTIAHSQTRHLKEICLNADILIAALGRPRFITVDMVKQGAVVVDVGINRLDLAKPTLVGDVDFENVKTKAAWITPVPGGVGPMTIAMLLSNTLKSYKLRA